ncbi:MAG: hypothetical protein DMF26_19545 [Verrucomicrobia bacterium]|nr:MAG: hypothetical protein DMF26_19545 [Verrucomicrobiota bacterium]
MSNGKKSGTVLQRIWWRIRDLYHQLKQCRFSVIVVIIACPVFLCVAQGTEILRTVGEGMAGGQWYLPRVFGFFAALILWALSSWYAARVLLYLDFPRAGHGQFRSKLAEKHVPRLLGVAPILVVSCGFLIAASSYDWKAPAKSWLYFFAGLCAVLAIAFYILLVVRRKWIGAAPEEKVKHVTQLGRATIVALSTMLIVSVLLFILFAADPVRVPQGLGMGTILFLAAASWVAVGSLFVYLGGRWQFPVITVLILLALLFSYWNDNHVIRTVPLQQVERLDVLQSFQKWHQLMEKNYPAETTHPLYIVATEGGGIRAAYWTATVLGGIQDKNANFAPHLFAISGVSGGSLGAAVFEALLAEPDPGSFKEAGDAILGRDFLSPTLAAMLYPDLVQRFIPWPIPFFDRGRALELGWEKAWRDKMKTDRFAGSFVDLWKSTSREWMPALFLNGTSVEKGNRIITSNLRVANFFLDAQDAAKKLSPRHSRNKTACHIPLSTAAHMSARFTFVSPAGRFRDGSHIVDGGYFENSAATTAYEIATRIKERCELPKHEITNVDVKVIMISNDPRKPPIDPAAPPPKPTEPKHTKKMTVSGNFLGDVTAPIYSLLNTRNARGTYAQKAIVLEQRPVKADEARPVTEGQPAGPRPKHIFYFRLRDTQVPLPLGWMLSKAAAQTMREQLELDDDVVSNNTAITQVINYLPPSPKP